MYRRLTLFNFLQEESESASGIFYSSDSQEEYTGRENSSFKNSLKSEEHDPAERKVGGGINVIPDSYSVDGDDSSNQPSVNSRVYLGDDFRSEMKPKMNVGSSRKLLEVAEDTVEELRAEAKMWERNARKLMVDLDVSRNELSKLSKKHAEMRMELSAVYAERDGLKREVEKLKLMGNQVAREDPTVHSESLVLMRKELENEIKYKQDMNDDLGQQLKRSQDSNVELVSVLQELEETIGEQRIEIESLSSLEFKYEKLLRDKSDELENERESNREMLSQLEKDHKYKMLIKEEEIANLEATLSGYAKDEHFERSDGYSENNHEDLVREMESLREKVEELEKDCTELTDENLELLLKLKDSNKTGIIRCSSVDSVSSEHANVYLSDESVVSDPKFQNAGFGSCEHMSEILKQLDVAFNLLKKPWHVQSIDGSETDTTNKKNDAATEMSPECIISLLQELNKLLEMRTTEFNELMRNHEIEIRVRDDVIADARKKMEDEILEVEQLKESKAKSEENYVHLMKEFDQKRSEFQQEKSHLKQDMEVQIQKLKDERELYLQETHHFKSVAMSLQDDIQRLKGETSIQISNLQRISEEESRELKDMNSGLERENHELHEKCSALVDQLNESKKSLSNCTKRVQLLEDHLSSVLEEFELRENSLKSDLEALIKEDNYQKDKLAQQVQSEAELRVQELTEEIAASKQSHERLINEHERILMQLANYKKSEEKLMTDLNDLELKHTISNYEREQLTKETAFLKMQLQNMSGLHDEILVLKGELKGCRVDKGRMEIELHNISGDYKELKAENIQLSEKMSEFEECKRIKLHLEEKLLEMDKDLATKEILSIQNADLKNELMETKRANVKIQQKMYRLEEDRDEWLKKAQALEENLKMMEARNNIHNEVRIFIKY